MPSLISRVKRQYEYNSFLIIHLVNIVPTSNTFYSSTHIKPISRLWPPKNQLLSGAKTKLKNKHQNTSILIIPNAEFTHVL